MTEPALNFENIDQPSESANIDITKRGFTGHEHLDNFELIHMNGRMYDFNNGRFLSVDPFIQGVDSQAINPYSYIGNNPLSGVDPTGYKIIWDRKECEKSKSSGACSSEVLKLVGDKAVKNGKEKATGNNYSYQIVDISSIEIDEDCGTSDCSFFREAQDVGGKISLVLSPDGEVMVMDFYRKPSLMREVVGPVAKEFFTPGIVDCSNRECSGFEKTMAGVEVGGGFLGKVFVKAGSILILIGKKGDEVADLVIDASTPVGRRHSPGSDGPDSPQSGGAGRHRPQHINGETQPVQNVRGVVNGREYSGHAFDQMRNRGLTPSVIDNAINNGKKIPGKTSGTAVYHDTVNNVRVVVNKKGRVVTVE